MSKYTVGNWLRVTCPGSLIFDRVGVVTNISRGPRWWQYEIVINGVTCEPIAEHHLLLAEEPAIAEAAP